VADLWIGHLGNPGGNELQKPPSATRFAEHYARVAQARDCVFLDTGQMIFSCDPDGIHLEVSEQNRLGLAVAARVCELLA